MDGAFEAFVSDATLQTLCGPQPVWQAQRARPVRGLNADAMRTLGCVPWVLKHHSARKPKQALLRAICIGRDVDSLAAIVLGMIGGREGLRIGEGADSDRNSEEKLKADGCSGIPLLMLQQLEAAEYTVETARAFGAWGDATQSP